jgi:hypothetical protein
MILSIAVTTGRTRDEGQSHTATEAGTQRELLLCLALPNAAMCCSAKYCYVLYCQILLCLAVPNTAMCCAKYCYLL